MKKNSTYALNDFVAAMLESARTFMYACVSALLAPRTSSHKRVYRSTYQIFMLLVLVSACAKPLPTFFRYPETGNSLYQKAWYDGCESGFSAYGNDYWRTFYSYKSDVKLMNTEKVYSRVWWDSFNYCRHYLNRYLSDGYWGAEGIGDGEAANFNQSLRNFKPIEEKGFSFPLWDGINTPGWGKDGEGDGYDYGWLGGGKQTNELGQPKTDWLGRPE